jgi:hypothetical protein
VPALGDLAGGAVTRVVEVPACVRPAAGADDARLVSPVVDDFPKNGGVGLRLRRRGSLVELASLHAANSMPSSSTANSAGRRTRPRAPTAVRLPSALGQGKMPSSRRLYAGRMRCPTETLGEGKGGRTADKGRETAIGEES